MINKTTALLAFSWLKIYENAHQRLPAYDIILAVVIKDMFT